MIDVRPESECRFDLVALGEVMLRLDPGEERIATTRTFRAWEGGGEYNVARGLHRCFALRTALVSAFVDNPIGRLLEDLIRQGGVDRSYVRWVPDDGVGRRARNGLNFTERGFGLRAALGCSDRGNSAASQLAPGDVDWDEIFGRDGARWFHCGGVFAALSDSTAALALEGVEAARRHGTVVSYDLNFRPSLWRGGTRDPAVVNTEIVDQVDVLFGNEEDYSAALGFGAADENFLELNTDTYASLLEEVLDRFPQLSLAAATLRSAHTATVNDWSAVARTRSGFHVGPVFQRLEILDRVGGGDSFAAGMIYGVLTGAGVDQALSYGVAHGALAMTTPGDTSTVTLAEVERAARGGAARVER